MPTLDDAEKPEKGSNAEEKMSLLCELEYSGSMMVLVDELQVSDVIDEATSTVAALEVGIVPG